MPRHKRRSHIGLIFMLAVIAIVISLNTLAEFMLHIPALVFIALIPVAYIIGTRHERYKATGRTTRIDTNTVYGQNIMSPYPPEMTGYDPDTCYYPDGPHAITCNPLTRKARLLKDPRSGVRPLNGPWDNQ